MGRNVTSIVKFNNDRSQVAQAVELAGGLSDLRPGSRVLLKPNLVMWDSFYPYPKFGVVTSSLVVEEMVKLLAEYGCSEIVIGEGSIVDKGLGSDTKTAFAGLGYHTLRDRYGVKLVDFNDGPFERVEFDGFALDVASPALQTDFLINLPVLKTHGSTKVSLGLKNLKGCLHTRSKMYCHHREKPLDDFVSQLADAVKPSLTVIDGIYTLERGPVVNGRAYRSDIVVASCNPFAADAIGAQLLGYHPDEVSHIRQFGDRHDISLADVDTVGEEVGKLARPLAWDWPWLPDNSGPEAFARQGISGIHYPKYDNTICSGCSYLNNYLLITLMGAYARMPFNGMEFLGGKTCVSQGGFSKTFLFGKCAMQLNRDNPMIREAVPIPGCPPGQKQILATLNSQRIPADDAAYFAYRTSLAKRYQGDPAFCEAHFQIE